VFVATLIKWEPGKMRKITNNRLKEALKDNQIRIDKNRDAIKRISALSKSQHKKSVHPPTVYMILLEWIYEIDYFYFKGYE
jgi:hypothetical protein